MRNHPNPRNGDASGTPAPEPPPNPAAYTRPGEVPGGRVPDVAAEIQHRRRVVLIVDDEPLNVRLFVEALKDEYEVRIAGSGAGALREIGQSPPPDLVLLDVTMPDLTGHQVCRIMKAREETRDVPVIFVTGRDLVTDETQGLDVGAVDYIVKPVPVPVLRARVRTHIELRRRTELLAALTATDGLTGIANRRHLDATLAREWRRCMRRGSSLGVVMLDVDFFKRYNDRYGHAAGDDCLRAVAHAVSGSVLRAGDLTARFGGEEFAAVLPDTDLPGTVTVAERIRQAVAALALPHEGSEAATTVTVSAGAASVVPGATEGGVEDLVQAADGALYAAKQAGRNRVAAADGQRPK
ncbi:MAG: diguanylate cyclase [Polyangiaceae bacterium]|nr:diguanylate cyclase [Polyangiaceae bacterium]